MGNKQSIKSPAIESITVEPVTVKAYETIKLRTIEEKKQHYEQRFNELSMDYIKQVNSFLINNAGICSFNSLPAIFNINTKYFKINYKFVNDEDDIILLNRLCDFIIDQFKHFNTARIQNEQIYDKKNYKYYYIGGIMFSSDKNKSGSYNNPTVISFAN